MLMLPAAAQTGRPEQQVGPGTGPGLHVATKGMQPTDKLLHMGARQSLRAA